jgi:hypothetical protein
MSWLQLLKRRWKRASCSGPHNLSLTICLLLFIIADILRTAIIGDV